MDYLSSVVYKLNSFTEKELIAFIYLFVLAFSILIILFYVVSIGLTEYRRFTRADLKQRAKKSFEGGKYKNAFFASLIALLLGVSSSGSVSLSVSNTDTSSTGSNYIYPDFNISIELLMIILVVCLFVLVLSFAFKVFVSNIIQVSLCRFFLRNLDDKPKFSEVFWGFKNGRYIKICTTMFLKDLYVLLSYLLFIVPGVIKSYQYLMVPYIMAENPDIKRSEAFRISKEMMKGNKWKTAVLDMSFIGWHILGVLACGIGTLFVNPYVHATYAALYERLRSYIPEYDKNNCLSNDIFKADEESEADNTSHNDSIYLNGNSY